METLTTTSDLLDKPLSNKILRFPDNSDETFVRVNETEISRETIMADDNNADDYMTKERSAFNQEHSYEGSTGFSMGQYKHLDTTANYAFFDGHIKIIRWLPEVPFRTLYFNALMNELTDIGIGAQAVTYTP
jgi:prepilin-type processing-associated H-X9-DG protein